MNPSTGLSYKPYSDGKWSIDGLWFDDMHTPWHSSYLIGQALFYILKAYDYEIRFKNCHHEEWLIFVKPIITKINKTKNTDGEYPFILSEKTGAGIEYDAFSGAWCMAALAYYCYLTGDKSHMDNLQKSERHYYEAYIKQMECYGALLDTDKATDSERIITYIKAIRFIHALTGDKQYLKHMKDAISNEF